MLFWNNTTIKSLIENTVACFHLDTINQYQFKNWYWFIVCKWKQPSVFSIKLLMVVLFQNNIFRQWLWGILMSCYFSILYLGGINNWTHFFYKNTISTHVKLRLKGYFHAIIEVHVLCANTNIGKVRASSKLKF